MSVRTPTDVLAEIQRRTTSVLSVGLEPCAEYLPPGFEPTIDGYERMLTTIIDSTRGLACAYKANLAFFEALGPEGWLLLRRIRNAVPRDVMFIADAKRGDIGTTARRYADAIFDWLDADAVTVNPLMGGDSVEPFLARRDRLTFILALTSNPGAIDFLMQDGLYLKIARSVVSWNAAGNCGMVVGATRAEQISEIREIARDVPFLIPGLGAQRGELERTARHGRSSSHLSTGLLFHVTRGVLPSQGDGSDVASIIRAKASDWCAKTWRAAREQQEVTA